MHTHHDFREAGARCEQDTRDFYGMDCKKSRPPIKESGHQANREMKAPYKQEPEE